jgi:hypothetical protein
MNAKEMTWGRSIDWAGLGRLAALMALGLLIPNLGMPQWLTGPLVNALLILTVLWLGVTQAILVGLVTPLAAALSGVLPLPLLVMIPFIALSNAVFVSVFGSLRSTNRWTALVAGAVAKSALLFVAVTVLVARPLSLIVAGQTQAVLVPAAIANMMTWPQLLTALAGGSIAFGIAWAGSRWSTRN